MEKSGRQLIYEMTDVSVTHEAGKKQKKRGGNFVLTQCAAKLYAGSLIQIIGKNGSGKSTFLSVLAGLLHSYTGSLTFRGQPMSGLRPPYLAKHIAYLAQSTDCPPSFTIRQIVDLGNYARAFGTSAAECSRRTEEAIRLAGITADPDMCFGKLSGGWQRRVLIARAICQSTQTLILDEPLSGLDIVSKNNTMRLLKNISDGGGLVIMSTHDIDLAAKFADGIYYCLNGRLDFIAPSELTEQKINMIFAE